jgi:hypothetical protein
MLSSDNLDIFKGYIELLASIKADLENAKNDV